MVTKGAGYFTEPHTRKNRKTEKFEYDNKKISLN